MEGCQLEETSVEDVGTEPSAGERLLVATGKRAQQVLTKVLRLPVVSVKIAPPGIRRIRTNGAPTRHAPLGLQPGESVRVRPVADIHRTLNEKGQCGGLAYMPAMERFSGRTFVVRKRIERFFDERTRKMLKVKGVVILNDVFCEVGLVDRADYGGCDRSCFLFWKEDWLVRASDEGSPS